jgi:hypothetical protein
VFLLEWRDTSLKNDGDVRLVTGLPVLAFVPVLVTRLDRRRAQRRRIAAGAALAMLTMVAAVAAYWVLRA